MASGSEVPHEIYRLFGIRNFYRYPPGTLNEQLENFRNPETRNPDRLINLVVTSTDDYNHAFKSPSAKAGSLLPIYMEAGSLTDIARAMLRTKKTLGPINNLIVAGHGAKDHIYFGGRNEVTAQDMLHSKALAKIARKGIFAPGARIVLLSCSTGQEDGGFAETVSAVSDMSVIAAIEMTGGEIIRSQTKPDTYDVIFPNYGPEAEVMNSSPSSIVKKIKRLKVPKDVGIEYRAGKVHKRKNITFQA
jgi:hypothetical protein